MRSWRGRIPTNNSLIGNKQNGARGGSRTHMRKNPRRILSPQRLPFRHPGIGTTNLTKTSSYCNITARADGRPLAARRIVTVLRLRRNRAEIKGPRERRRQRGQRRRRRWKFLLRRKKGRTGRQLSQTECHWPH